MEIAVALADAWNRGDREAFLALWDEEAEFVPLRAQLEGESYRGHDGLQRFLAEMTEDFEAVRFEIILHKPTATTTVGNSFFNSDLSVIGYTLWD